MGQVVRWEPLRMLRRRYGSLSMAPRVRRSIPWLLGAAVFLAAAVGFGLGWLSL